jgi:gluconate 5-dehydrogenase
MPYSDPENAPRLSSLFSLKGRTALVVGGAGLLGGEISYGFAELGADLIIASRELGRCRSFVEGLRRQFTGINAQPLQVDITQSASVEALLAEVARLTGGHLDILVNSGWSGRKNTFESINETDWNLDIEVNLNGVFRTVKAAFPLLRQRSGNILNIASMYGHVAPDYRLYDSERFANPPSYGAAKAGVIQLTKYLASFLSPYGIRANCISPGPFPYESTQRENPEFIARLSAKNPLNRVGRPHDIKGAAVLLCTDAGAYMTGQNVCVDGGWGAW